jgi:hypothetical protein
MTANYQILELVPFSGPSSETIGALLAGRDDVTGIEQ